MQNRRLRILSYVVIAYMLVAFLWWSVLLYTKNQDAFLAKAEYWKIMLIAREEVQDAASFQQTELYKNLHSKYKQQEWMIFGEAAVFVISLVIGVYLINRAYSKEMNAAQQRRNFLLSITHELKSPIASIRLILETFLKRNLSEQQLNKFSQNALTEADRLHTLVNDLLLAARMEVAYQPNLEQFKLDRFLEEIVQKLNTKYPKVEFNLRIPQSLPSIEADRLGMTSVALNLLENAVKYSPNQAKIDIHLFEESGKVYWEVADSGSGIPDEEKKKVFDRFYRVGNEDTRKTKGTGLGLYIVKQIVQAHKGMITILDNKPQGTIFKISLPCASF
ncbi:MAG: ATP-binding protein [Bacteroidota bacterium]